jgi:hypothetical protein
MHRALVLGVVAFAIPIPASAAPCDQLGLGDIVYAQVGDTQTNLMKRLGRALRDNQSRPLTLVWKTSGSCSNIELIYESQRIPASTVMSYVPSVAEDPTWTTSSPTLTCEVPAGGVLVDVANSALFNSACTSEPPPATVHLTNGPVQAYVLAVPKASTQKAITFEEAYFVFGLGAAGMVAPWTIETEMFIRTITKSTLLAWAANISVPADKWKGVRHDGSPMVVSSLLGSTNPENAIGILGGEVYDALRDQLNVLAFRARGQYAAYYPDSTATSFDKKNVRDGHYTVWSPTIWMDRVTGTTPTSANARYVIDLLAGRSVSPAPSFDMIDIIASVGLVPDCAMEVQREYEGGPLSLYQPPESCTCKYESIVDSSSCATCSETEPCASGVCRNGFCEVR